MDFPSPSHQPPMQGTNGLPLCQIQCPFQSLFPLTSLQHLILFSSFLFSLLIILSPPVSCFSHFLHGSLLLSPSSAWPRALPKGIHFSQSPSLPLRVPPLPSPSPLCPSISPSQKSFIISLLANHLSLIFNSPVNSFSSMWCLYCIFNPLKSLHFLPWCYCLYKRASLLTPFIFSIAALSSQPPSLPILESLLLHLQFQSFKACWCFKSHLPTCPDQALLGSE